jgi:hypothetical protein
MSKIIRHDEIYIMISEPWEFGSQFGCGPFKCKVRSIDKNKMLIQFVNAIEYKKILIEYLVAQPRYNVDIIEELENGNTPEASFTRISKSDSEKDDPFDLSSWRGGIAFLGTLYIKKPN